MSGKVIGLSLLAISVLGAVGGAGYVATQEPELFNDFVRTAAYTPKQSYSVGKPESIENTLYENVSGEIIPFVIKSKEDITKVDELHSDIFGMGDNPFNASDIKTTALSYFETPEQFREPYSVYGTTSGKDACFIIGGDGLFEQQSLLARCSIDRTKIYDYVYDKAEEDVSNYLSFYNDKYNSDDLIENVYVDYYYKAAGDVKAALQLKQQGDKYHALIQKHMRKRATNTANPNYDFNMYTNTHIEVASSELDAGNIKFTTDFYQAFAYVNDQIIGTSVSSYNLLELLMFEKEAIERNNTAREYIFEDNEIRTFIGLPELKEPESN